MERNWTATGVRLPAEIPAQTNSQTQTSNQTMTIMSYLIIKPISDQLSRMFRERCATKFRESSIV